MSSLSTEHQALLIANLKSDYIAHLPSLLPHNKSQEEQDKKNLSRALSAFALSHLLAISEKDAAESVIDDFNDIGIDAIFFHGPTQTLYFVQTKFKKGAEFQQEEALAFCQGIRKLLVQDFTGFNDHFNRRKPEIENALNECDYIKFVIAHIGSGISHHASTAISDLIKDETHGDGRLSSEVINFDSSRIVPSIQASRANKRIDATLIIHKWGQVSDPRITFFGYVNLIDLVKLYSKENSALFDKNIRLFLGPKTGVSKEIQKTLAENPSHFFYLNNGITVLCERIEAKSTTKRGSSKRLKISGFSIINGAQTVSSASQFVTDNPNADISSARVSITLIKADADGAFGKSVTRCRNYQNTVESAHFLALDDEHERLRRELAILGIEYSYKAEQNEGVITDTKIKASEAVHALALFHKDPRYILWLKNEPSSLLDIFSNRYKELITPRVTAFSLVNAVRFARYVNNRMISEAQGHGPEKLTYKHGAITLAWILAKRLKDAQNESRIIEPTSIASVLSVPFDSLRQNLWDVTYSELAGRTPLVLFRNQSHTLPIAEKVMLKNYGLENDAVIPLKRAQKSNRHEAYPEDLFNYMISIAPQIGGLA